MIKIDLNQINHIVIQDGFLIVYTKPTYGQTGRSYTSGRRQSTSYSRRQSGLPAKKQSTASAKKESGSAQTDNQSVSSE